MIRIVYTISTLQGMCLFNIVVIVSTLIAPLSSGLSDQLLSQIERSQDGVKQIKKLVLEGSEKYGTFNRLTELGDKHPYRISGSPALENAIDYILNEMTNEGLDNVHGEDVKVPKWTRGKEYGEIRTATYTRPMAILALGSSIGTNGTTAPVVVVRSFDELKEKDGEIRGKIVVYNQPWKGYSNTVMYRSRGASEASKYGAIGALVRSVTDFSIYSPHTGIQNYNPNYTKIPVACITAEDADLLQRFYDRKEAINVSIYSEAMNYPDTTSRNIVAEIKGSTNPEQVVIFGGHIDSWDVGTGSMDDGGGVMISWQALSIIKKLQLKPKRTLRVVLWTSEEFGLFGGDAYYLRHKNESDNVSLIMESDHGVFNPKGLHFSGSGLATAIMEEILKMTNDINASTILEGGGGSSDTDSWVTYKNVPGAELYSSNENYFFFHHSNGDTMNVLDKDQLDRATILWATTVYAVANLDDILPRDGAHPARSLSVRPAASFHVVGFLVAIGAVMGLRRIF